MDFFSDYFELINQNLRDVDTTILVEASELIKNTSNKGKKLIIAGNGGSASIASHMAVDFTKAAKIKATCFNESSLITCFSNDYGYEKWLEKAIETYAVEGDTLILISSSGNSQNIINAASKAKQIGVNLVTFSGFSKDNPLRKMGDINFWVNSKGYNIVEMAHHIWLVAIVDYIVGKVEYSA